MVTYYLAIQPADGRIVLDRECHGFLAAEFTVDEPSVIRREIDGEMVDCPQYHESFEAARRQVDESKLRHVRGEGYFLARKQ